jgi:hypothetical protein
MGHEEDGIQINGSVLIPKEGRFLFSQAYGDAKKI